MTRHILFIFIANILGQYLRDHQKMVRVHLERQEVGPNHQEVDLCRRNHLEVYLERRRLLIALLDLQHPEITVKALDRHH